MTEWNCQRVTCAWLMQRKFSFTTYFTLCAKWWNIGTWVETAWWDLLQGACADGGNTPMTWWVVLFGNDWNAFGFSGVRWWAEHERTQQGTTFVSDSSVGVWLFVRAGCWIRLGGGTWCSSRLSSRTWSDSASCVSFANVLSPLGLFLRCCSDIKAASGGIQPR